MIPHAIGTRGVACGTTTPEDYDGLMCEVVEIDHDDLDGVFPYRVRFPNGSTRWCHHVEAVVWAGVLSSNLKIAAGLARAHATGRARGWRDAWIAADRYYRQEYA